MHTQNALIHTHRVGGTILCALLVAGTGVVFAQAPPGPKIPADTATTLKQRVGKWTSEGSGLLEGKQQTVSATADCKAFAGGVGVVCTWTETASASGKRRRIQLLGYDLQSNMLRISSLDNRGFSESDTAALGPTGGTIHFEGKQDGKPLVGTDEISISPDANEAKEHVTVDVAGKRTVDLTITHKRTT
jgi:hypothetical protein